jgi:sirohydrochlorin cobaltochelatase
MRKLIGMVALTAACAVAQDGLLVVAHGARAGAWNDRVLQMMQKVDWSGPKAVGFLTPRNPEEALAAAAARLDAAGVKRIVLVPLMVSSFSTHYEEIRYYAGDRKTAPEHHTQEPLKTRAELLLTSAMDADRLLGLILADQLRTVSTRPESESVMLVAHGPNGDADDAKWLACLKVLAAMVQSSVGFKRVDAATVRDDAPKVVKDAAVAGLRDRVKTYAADSTVLVQPVLISSGHVQAEIVELLKGLEFQMSKSGVSNHPLAPEWVRQQATLRLRLAGVHAQN